MTSGLVVPATLTAPAKLTWSLRVVGTRPDGLHLIEAEMVTLDLVDSIDLSIGSGVVYRGEHVPDLDPEASADLVSRALAIVGADVRAVVTKRIPAGAGLGGGSADAAAILRWGGVRDLGTAVSLGADVAFCLEGGRARVEGIGERIIPLEHVDRTVTLLTPPIHCSTPAVYRRWDELGGPSNAAGNGPAVNGLAVNDLESAALSVSPELGIWRDRLREASGQEPRLAGSGSTWFVEGSFPGAGRVVARTTGRQGDYLPRARRW